MKKIATVVGVMALSLGVAGEATKTYTNGVNKIQRTGTSSFEVQGGDHIAILKTIPVNATFEVESGQVSASKRHGKAIWVETKDLADLHEAKSPVIPNGKISWVICDGRFAKVKKDPAQVAGEAAPVKPKKELRWKSSIIEPGVHLIVANAYNTDDAAPREGKPTMNEMIVGSAKALKQEMEFGGAGTVHLGVCGLPMGSVARVPIITNFATYVASLNVDAGKLSTFTTVGHGAPYILKAVKKAECVLIYARPEENKLHYVGNGAFQPNVKDLTIITNVLKPLFIASGGILTLDHCDTGSVTYTRDGQVYNFVSLAKRFKTALPDEAVVGHKGTVTFKYIPMGRDFMYYPPINTAGGMVVLK